MKGDAASAWPSTLGHSPWSSDPSDKMSAYPEAATLEGGHAGTTKNRDAQGAGAIPPPTV